MYKKLKTLAVDGVKLTSARIAMQLSQEDVATKIGVNRSSICRWEQGIGQPTSDKLIGKMAKVLKTKDFIVTRSEGEK
jgi:transcriptional regulator with XRE-family HTH domain